MPPLAEVCSRLEPRLAPAQMWSTRLAVPRWRPPPSALSGAPSAWRQKIWSTSRCRCCSYNDAAAATGVLLQLVDRTGDIQARPAAGHISQMARPVPGPLTYDAGTVGHHVRRFLAFEHYMDSEHVRTKSRFTSDGISPLAVYCPDLTVRMGNIS